MDAIALLKKDHASVKKLFKRLLDDREIDHVRASETFARLREELSIHTEIEEQILYPAIRKRAQDFEEDVLEALEEHHVAKMTLAELEKMSLSNERFEPKLAVLRQTVMQHVVEEEATLFPALREAFEKDELLDMARKLTDAKRVAPKHPRPKAPDTPPGNRITGLIAGGVDRVRDLVTGVARMATSPLRPARRGA